MGKDKTPDPVTTSFARDGAGVEMAAYATDESDGAVPSRRVSEHEVSTGRPVRELEELRRPHHASSTGEDEVTEGWVVGVHDTTAQYPQSPAPEILGMHLEAPLASQAPDARDQLGSFVGHEPRIETTSWLCSRAPVEHHP